MAAEEQDDQRDGRQAGPDWVVNSVSGSVVIGSVVQGRDITVQLPPQVPAGLNGWRAPAPEFVGRAEALTGLLEVLAPAPGHGTHPGSSGGQTATGTGAGVRARVALVTAAVAGLGGIGKTELAVQAVHLALAEGWFGGGVLAIDLHGYTSARLTAEQAVANLLRGLGAPDEVVPAAFDERVRMYRAILAAYADLGTPILVVLDNASPDTDLQDLLPGAGRAIVTSRHILARLPAQLLDLDVLSDDDAAELLARLLTSKRPTDARAADHPDTAAEVAKACAGLPLAIHLVAALLAAQPRMPLTVMADRLGDETTRLSRIDDDRPGLHAAFTLSYQALPTDQQRMFRLITLNPGPHISTTAAAATALLWPDEGERLVERLAEAHLIEASEPYGWWRMHDLVRQYATSLGHHHATTDHRDQALERLLEHYLDTTRAAAAHLDPAVADPAALGFGTREQALEWLDTEIDNLVAAVYTAAGPRPEITVALPLHLGDYLEWRRWFSDWITLTTLACDTANRTYDQPNEATAWNNLGNALRRVGRGEEAITACETALDIFRELGYQHREAMAWNNLGLALRQVGRYEEAISACQTALDIYRRTGDRHREAGAWGNLGLALEQVGRDEEAITAHQTALDIFCELGHRRHQAMAWNNLGNALQRVERFEEAITAHQTALDLHRETGDRHSEARALVGLGGVLRQIGHGDQAVQAHTQAAALFDELGDEVWHAEALRDIETDRGATASE
ncbi:DUF3856 domain-containing protein [Actinomadura barringtoniae]|uniref:DUF3856 domain-containing protein n=1 Tax=Actinomadura barringtoniae TaxID=1427535 RepID=A0A939PCJ6_9ACTN|nr:tetratricopeptide repeat protein [Actinomadura barringtoniae]MBO2445981.1 DUF3856 domain-containing protein [Actinomadura barringtoniae]